MSDTEKFDDVFRELLGVLTEHNNANSHIVQVFTWFNKMLCYNVPFGKKNRGESVVTSYRSLNAGPSEENLKLARIVGWCVEILQAFFLVTDDIMDASLTRRGQPCWYKNEGVGLIAVNDSAYLEGSIYTILRLYFKDKPYYVNLLELFHEATIQTLTGQCLDVTTAPPEGTTDFTKFTLERYSAIVKWKTAFYSFYLPVAAAMYMSGVTDEDSHACAKTILLKMGHFFQVQDDYLDCYGDPKVIGKIGTDIEDNKCSWMVVQALKRANAEQKQILENSYGCHDEEKVKRVKSVYGDLKLTDVYLEFEEDSYNELTRMIDSSERLPKEMFIQYVNRLYKRDK